MQRIVYPVFMNDYYIGENVRMLRKSAGLSQAQLAEKMRAAGRDTWWQTTVSRVENNSQAVEDLEDLEVLGDILKGSVTKGTPLGQRMKVFSEKIVWMNIESRLHRAEEALAVALQNLDEAKQLVQMKREKQDNGDD
ncbi:hypothetical protein CXR26_16000 [Brevibacterium aurantiacum]|nr:hypothetical protein CXR26_16000 [Brevibacterium aurantiacum]